MLSVVRYAVRDGSVVATEIGLEDYRIGLNESGNPHNSQIYRAGTDTLVKIPSDELRADSPFKHRTPEERVGAAVQAYRIFPDLFTETRYIEVDGSPAVVQREVEVGGPTIAEALESGDYAAADRFFGKLRKLHEKGYVLGDFKEDLPVDGKFFDGETFGVGDPLDSDGGDLVKVYRDAVRDGYDGVLDHVLSRHYGAGVGSRLAEAS